MSDETYTLPVACTNCDYTGTVSIPKGTQFSDQFDSLSKYGAGHRVCPNCGCSTLSKGSSPKEPRFDRMWLNRGEDDSHMLCDNSYKHNFVFGHHHNNAEIAEREING